MKPLTPQEVSAWWSRVPILYAEKGRVLPEAMPSVRVNANFSNERSTFPIAQQVAKWLLAFDEMVLVSVFEHGIWPSEENLYLFYLFRRSLGAPDLLEDTPGHLFLKHEHQECATLLQLSFLFGWGVNCGSFGGERAFHVNHDGKGLLIASSSDSFSDLVPRWIPLQ